MIVRSLALFALLALLVLVPAPVALGQDPAGIPGAQLAQEPEPPGGEPQPGAPDEPDDPIVPIDEPPGEEPTVGGQETLPRTGVDALWLALGGVALLLIGARLRVLTRIREAIRRYRTPKAALRDSLQELREAGADHQRRLSDLPPPVEPTTPPARRMSGAAEYPG